MAWKFVGEAADAKGDKQDRQEAAWSHSARLLKRFNNAKLISGCDPRAGYFGMDEFAAPEHLTLQSICKTALANPQIAVACGRDCDRRLSQCSARGAPAPAQN